jgi:hypothetical protein
MLHNPSAPLLHNLGSFAPQPRLLCSLADDAPQSQLLCLFDSTDHVFASFTIKLSTMQPTSCIRESPALPTKESRDFLHGQLKWPSFSILSHWCPKNTRDPTLDAWYKQTLVDEPGLKGCLHSHGRESTHRLVRGNLTKLSIRFSLLLLCGPACRNWRIRASDLWTYICEPITWPITSLSLPFLYEFSCPLCLFTLLG